MIGGNNLKRNLRVIHIFVELIFFNIVMFFVPYSVRAAGTEGLVVYQGENEGQQYANVAVCMDVGDGQISLLAFLNNNEEEGISAEIVTEEKSFPIKMIGTYANTIGIWRCEEDSIQQCVNVYKTALPIKGEQAAAVYIFQGDNGAEIGRQQVTVNESCLLNEDNPDAGYAILFDKIENETYMNSFLGALENENGECIGVILENGIACPISYDDSVFNSSTTEEKTVEEQSQKQPERTIESKTEKQTEDQSQKKTDAQAKDQWEKIGEILGGFIITILFAVFFIRRMLKKNKPTPPLPEPEPDPIPTPGPPPVPNPRPVPPAPKPAAFEPANLFLYIESGHMAGQAYPIGNDKVMIGRSNKCRIQYPKDYAGVSTIHASVFYLNGKLYLKDEDSSYGTYLKTKVGAKKLEPTQPQELHEGSEFYIAEEKNVIRVVNVAAKNKR